MHFACNRSFGAHHPSWSYWDPFIWSALIHRAVVSQMKSAAREVKVLSKARDALEVDFKAVLARHAREVDVAATARREAAKAQAARAAAEAEAQHVKVAAAAATQRLLPQVRFRIGYLFGCMAKCAVRSKRYARELVSELRLCII